MATKRGSAAIAKDPKGSARIQWENWAPDGWFDEATFGATKSLSLPAIFIQGKEDGVTQPKMSKGVYAKFTGWFERILLQNVGHFPQREDPEAVGRELAVFFDGKR